MQGDGCVAADLTATAAPTSSSRRRRRRRCSGTTATARSPRARTLPARRVRLVHGRGGRRRQRRRPPGPVRRRLHRPEPAGPDSIAGFPTNLAGVRDLLFLTRERRTPRRSARSASRPASRRPVPPRPGRPVHRRERRRSPRPLRRERRGPEPALRERALARRCEGRPGRARLPLRGARSSGGRRGPVRRAWASRRRTATAASAFRDELAGRAVGGVPRDAGSPAFANARPPFDPALGTGFAGWGASWVDLANSGTPDLVLTAGAIPVTSLAARRRARARARARSGAALEVRRRRGVLGRRPRAERAWARGGRRGQRRPHGHRDQHDRRQARAAAPDRARAATGSTWSCRGSRPARSSRSCSRTAGGCRGSAGGQQLPLVRGSARALRARQRRRGHAADRALPVGRRDARSRNVRADRVVDGRRAGAAPSRTPAATSDRLAAARRDAHGRRSRASGTTRRSPCSARATRREPVQARDLFDLSAAMWDAWAAYDPTARLLRHREGAGGRRRARATRDQLRGLPAAALAGVVRREPRPDVRAADEAAAGALLLARLHGTAGDSPAALGNRIAAAAIAYGRHDGSLEALHYADPTYTPRRTRRSSSRQPGSTVHDATFWQPLALGQVAPHGLGAVPASVQTFAGAQWGGAVRALAGKAAGRPGAPRARRPVGRGVPARRRRGDPRDRGRSARRALTRRRSAGTPRGRSGRRSAPRPRATTSGSTSR